MFKRNLIVLLSFLLFIFLFIVFDFNKNNKNNSNEVFKNPVKIVFISDKNYILPTRTAIKSIIANKLPSTQIEFFIIGINLKDKSISKLKKETRKNVKIHIIKFPVKKLKSLSTEAKLNLRITKADNAKFFIASTLKNVDKIIYLDGDVIVRKDLSDLYNMNLGNNYIAAVDDWQSKWNDKPDERYFNCGLMLIDLKKIRENNIEDKLLEYKKNDKINRFLTQDAYNAVMKGKTYFLPLKYDTFAYVYDKPGALKRIKNRLKSNYNDELYPYKTNIDFKKDVVVIHYCGFGNIKPWWNLDFLKTTNRIWYQYAPFDFWIGYFLGEYKVH